MNNTQINFKSNLLALMLIFISTSLWANNKVAVIPLAGDDLKAMRNVITVAKTGGDFTDVISAMAVTSSAALGNEYLIVIAPGTYQLSEQLVMRPYVNIAGSGRDITILQGFVGGSTFGASSALVLGANHASLKDLSLFNQDRTSLVASGIYNGGTSPIISNIGITLIGGFVRYGIINSELSAPTIRQVHIEQFASNLQIGIQNNNASSTISETTISLSGSGNVLAGVENTAGGSSIINASTIILSGTATSRYGVTNSSTAGFSRVRNSTFSGDTAGVNASSGVAANETYIFNTIMDNSPTGDPFCSFVFLMDGSELGADCASI